MPMSTQKRFTGLALLPLALLFASPLPAQVEIAKIEFVGDVYRSGYGDNWQTTWASDGWMYTSMGDGTLPVGTDRCKDEGKQPMMVGGLRIRNNEIFRIRDDFWFIIGGAA